MIYFPVSRGNFGAGSGLQWPLLFIFSRALFFPSSSPGLFGAKSMAAIHGCSWPNSSFLYPRFAALLCSENYDT